MMFGLLTIFDQDFYRAEILHKLSGRKNKELHCNATKRVVLLSFRVVVMTTLPMSSFSYKPCKYQLFGKHAQDKRVSCHLELSRPKNKNIRAFASMLQNAEKAL